MRKRSILPLALAGLASSGAGCGVILGLGDYKDADTGGAGGASSSTTSASSAASSTGGSSPAASSTGSSSTSSSTSGAGGKGGQGGGGGGGTGGAGGAGGGMVCVPGATLPCLYNGPNGTDGHGICQHATQTCVMDGSGYSACNGEVDPNPAGEVCGNGKDDDCNGMVDDGCTCTIGMDYPCYNGPGNSDMFPPCHDGVHTCIDGHSFGSCTGEQDPVTEVCGNNVDDNCNGMVDEVAAGCICTPGSSQVCWTGLPQNRNVGDCKDGSQLCAADGKSWLACTGQTLPVTEDCAVKGDEDCNSIPCSELVWANAWGGSDGFDAAWDSASSVYLVGDLSGSVDFGSGALVPQGGYDAFVAKFDQTGKSQWSLRFGDAADQRSRAVAVDAQDNVIFGGTFAGTMKIGAANLASSSSSDINIFAAKLKSDGTPLWAVGFGDSADQTLRDLAVDPMTGDVIIVGEFAGTIAFGNGSPPMTSTGQHDAFVARLRASDGAVLWRKGIGFTTTPMSEQSASSVVVDPGGAVVVAGDYGYSGTGVTLGATNYPTANIWLARFDAMGNLAAGKGFTANNGFLKGSQASVASFKNGDILFTGAVSMDPAFGGPAISAGGFAARFSSTLAHQWSQGFGAGQLFYGAVDHADQPVLTSLATASATFNFGGHMVTPPQYGGVVTKLDGMGNWVWTQSNFALGGLNTLQGIAVSPANLVTMVGSSYNQPTFAGVAYGANQTWNAYLATFYP